MKKLVLIALYTISSLSANMLTNQQKANNLITNLYGLNLNKSIINQVKNTLENNYTLNLKIQIDTHESLKSNNQSTNSFLIIDIAQGIIEQALLAAQLETKIFDEETFIDSNNNIENQAHDALYIKRLDNDLDLTEKVHFEAPESWLEWIGRGFDDMVDW